MTLAQAVGDMPLRGLSFTPGVDYDPHDEDDREAVRLAMELDVYDRNRALMAENAQLRAELAEYRGEDGY